jgi:hypothetical protein
MKQIDELIQREVTRKEFLATLGFGVLSIMGLGSIMKLLSGKGSSLKHNVSSGYGSSPYGG